MVDRLSTFLVFRGFAIDRSSTKNLLEFKRIAIWGLFEKYHVESVSCIVWNAIYGVVNIGLIRETASNVKIV